MANPVLQKLVNLCSGQISRMLNNELPNLSKFINDKVNALNAQIENEGPLSFNVPLFGNNSVNLTMTESPDLNTPNLVRVFFDGLILNENSSYTSTEGIITPPRLAHNNSEQIWMHERMVGTLFNSLKSKVFPMILEDDATSEALRASFPEIEAKYGSNVILSLQINELTNSADFLKLDSKRGIVFGETGIPTANVSILVTLPSGEVVRALNYKLNLAMVLDFQIDAFVCFPAIKSVTVGSVTMLPSAIQFTNADLASSLTSVLERASASFNT